MAYQLSCPCGTSIAELDDDFLPAVNRHLEEAHPGRSYPAEAVMGMASRIPDEMLAKLRARDA